MKRRIFIYIVELVLISVLLLSALLSILVYNSVKKNEIDAVKDRAGMIADLLNSGLTEQIQFADFFNYAHSAARMTVISADGTVLLDNKADAADMENHLNRAELIQALRNGVGEDTRTSETLGDETYYYAIALNDGNVIRVSKTMSSIAGVFSSLLPAVLAVTALILLLAAFVANRLTKRIVDPLNVIDLDSPEYDGESAAIYEELLPYVKKIEIQKREISEQINMLKERANTIEAITDSMKEGLILIDKNGNVLTANKSTRDIFGDAEQSNILHICRDLDFQRAVDRCLNGSNVEISLDRSGNIFSVFLNPVYSDNMINGAIILFLDTTEKFLSEKQRREFSANVSHELKTPLTAISALAEMIKTGMSKEGDAIGFAAKISEQSKRLINMIDDIIRLSEFDEGNIVNDKSLFDLYELAETIVLALNDNAKDIKLKLTGERMRIFANRRMIDELLFNLIDNGIKYNQDGGTVVVILSRENGSCVISVADTGIGIPKEHKSRVFERFYRVDRSRSKKTGGTGLGLSIVKNIAEHHGGNVQIESCEGTGTTVTCYLPAIDAEL